jgi:hypothetical protein
MNATLFTLALAIAQLPAIPARTEAGAVRARTEVERSAREFRRAVYENFRTDREEFDRRWSAGEKLYSRWTELRQPAIHGETIAAWYHEAARATLTGRDALPPLPYLPVPASLRDDRRSRTEMIVPPAPVPLSAPANDAAEEDNPFLPVLPDDDDAPPPPPDAESDDELPSQIRSLLDLGGSAFGK